ncbi:MAG: hypothetical protein ACSLFQ_03640, partial [Thermoanaerobaculia bacterium]
FKPETKEEDQAQGQGGRSGGSGARSGQQGQTVYVLEKTGKNEKGELREVRIRTGITDGRHTQVASVVSGELKPGDQIVTGLATLKVEPSRTGMPMGRF